MRLFTPKFEILEQQYTEGTLLNDMYKHIEKCGRTCYKSEDKITDTSAWPFVKRMIASEHNAMLEHGTIYLYFCFSSPAVSINYMHFFDMEQRYKRNKHSRVNKKVVDGFYTHVYVTTNLRVIVENGWQDDLKFICTPCENHFKRYTVQFTCDRGVSHEFVRHRVFSFAQESTRYCNYSKDKFENSVSYVYLPWCDTDNAVEPEHNVMEYDTILPYNTHWWNAIDWWLWSISAAETAYFKLLEYGWTAQQARTVLPTGLKTELVMTGFKDDWDHFFNLRALGTTGAPHPQAKELAEPLMAEFGARGYLEEI